MKKANIATLFVFFLILPITLYVGTLISGKGYYVTGTVIIIELMIPFFMAFEGKKPQARELVVIAVMCTLAIVGRVAIPIPNFKAAFAIIMISGIAFGPQTGYVVGAITALVSDFFYGQGAYMPWQMMAYGAGGMLAGFIFQSKRLKRTPWTMAIVGFLLVLLWIGPLLDCAHLFLMMPEINKSTVFASLASGFPVNISQATSTVLIMLVFGRPLLDKLERIKLKYGMMEG